MGLKELFRSYVYPIAMLSGSIIGVGFFALPYVAMQTGIWLMLLYFAVVTAIIVFLHVIFAEISLKTPDHKRFPGFAKFYFGRKGEAVALVVTILGILGALLAYLIVGGEFLTSILQPSFGGSNFAYTLIYFVLAGIIIFLGIKTISKVELWVLLILFLSILFVFLNGFLKIKAGNILIMRSPYEIKNILLPFGPLMFALWGIGLIPEVEEMLIGKKHLIKKVVIIATLIPALFYVLFVLLVLSISGAHTSDSALVGLKFFLGDWAIMAALFAGVLSTFVAFVAQGFLLERTLILDLGIKKWQAFSMAVLTPLILFMLGVKSFIPLVSVLGGVLIGVSGILVLMMYKKIGGKKIVIYPLSLVFIAGIIYQIFYFFI